MKNKSNQSPLNKKQPKSEFFRFLGIASTVGINLVISTFIGFAIGYYLLDRFFNTFPWFTIIFLLIGIASGFKYLFKIISRMGNEDGNTKGSN